MEGLGPTAGAARLVPAPGRDRRPARHRLARDAPLRPALRAPAAASSWRTTLAFLSFARVAMSDMLLALLDDAGGRAWPSSRIGPGPPPGPCRSSAPCLGLGFATKGPIALLVPGLASCCSCGSAAAGRSPAAGARSRSAASPSPFSASAGSCSSTGGWARGLSRTSSSARTSSASRARPTTWAGPSGSTRRPTSPRASPGRRSSRSRRGASCARARATRPRAPGFSCSGSRSSWFRSASRAARSTTTCCPSTRPSPS